VGFDLIKHDYTTYDVFAAGLSDGLSDDADGWTFASGPTHTTAEVIRDLYRTFVRRPATAS